MKKNYAPFLLWLVAALTMPLSARTLTPAEALQRALSSASSTAMKSPASSPADVRLALTRMAADEPAVYVFSAGETGYYVVSADDATTALLGYADDAVLPADTALMPPALLYWIDEYARQVAYARQHTPVRIPQPETRAERAAIAPLLSTRWDQDTPYNNMCPTVGGERCYTGCVATAMAQVMNCHKWPDTGEGSKSYAWNSTTLAVDFSTASYDWAHMTDTYSDASTDEEQKAVATLMYHCGVAAEMSYGTGSSGAKNSNAARAFVQYFKYNKNIRLMPRDCYTIGEWEDVVYAQLQDYGPVWYDGSSEESGHAFVCDGYSGDGYFHINWGWGGTSNGYFKLNALTPASQGIGGSGGGYNFGQTIIANIKRAEASDVVTPYLCATDSFYTETTSATLGTQVAFLGGIYNYGVSPISGSVGLKFTDTETGEVTYSDGGRFEDMQFCYGYTKIWRRIPATMSAGTYRIVPVVKDTDGTYYDIPCNVSKPHVVLMTVSGSTATFESEGLAEVNISDLSATAFYANTLISFYATITNTTDLPFSGSVRACLLDTDVNLIGIGDALAMDLDGGASADLTYTTKFVDTAGDPVAAGTYYLVFLNQDGYVISSWYKITLQSDPSYDLSITSKPMPADGNTEVNRHAFTISTTVKNASGYYYNVFHLFLMPLNADRTYYQYAKHYTSEAIILRSGKSATLTFDCSLDEGAAGGECLLKLIDGDGNDIGGSFSYYGLITFAEETAIAAPAADDATVVSVQFYDLAGHAVDAATAATGPCIKVERLASGQIRTSKTLQIHR